MSKKIILFGASGLLGSELGPMSAARGYELEAPSRREVNLEDTDAIEQYIETSPAEIVINAAALINVDTLEKDPLPGWRVNAMAPAAMTRAAAKRTGCRIIHLSTQYVFDGTKPFYTEEEKLSPINIYGATKALSEELVQSYGKKEGMRTYIARTCWLFGAKRPTFVDEVAKTLRRGETFLATKEQYGNPTQVADLARAILDYLVEGEYESGIYHLINQTPEQGVSRYDIAQEVARATGASEALVQEAQASTIFATRRPSAVLSNTKIPPLPNWREALHQHFAATRFS